MALPGVQVLFAFLLTIPFNQRFAQLTTAQERIYLGTLIASMISATLSPRPHITGSTAAGGRAGRSSSPTASRSPASASSRWR